MPGCVIAMARLNRPALMVYGGTIRAGFAQGKPRDIISAFQSYGEYLAGVITDEQRLDIVDARVSGRRRVRWHVHGEHDGHGDRGARPVAAVQFVDPGRGRRQGATSAVARARRFVVLLEKDLKPRDIVTQKSFENALVMVMAVGGSTNAVLHLIAMAKAAGVPLALDGFPARERSRAAARGPQAERHVRAGGSARRRRHAGADEVPARARDSCTATA